MIIQSIFPISCKRPSVWFAVLAVITLLAGCGGGSSSSGVGAAGNQNPTATISEPTGTYFKEGENITFSGIATDAQGSQLDGAALVWTSDIDGPIGNGATFATSALSTGDHQVTLSATDSNGSAFTTAPHLVHVEPTRFIKMGRQTIGVSDASNAFDGDQDTAATIMATDTEIIHFMSYIGTADTFGFNIKAGPSTPGSRLNIQGLTANDTWESINDVFLTSNADQTATIEVKDAQAYKDSQGYINLRVLWVNGQLQDNATIYELWRIDPIYAGSQTTNNVSDPELAFDGDGLSKATITEPYNLINQAGTQNFLHFKAYVGLGVADSFSFKVLTNNLGDLNFLTISVEDLTTALPDDWMAVTTITLNTGAPIEVIVSDVQNYIDQEGYINLRASWVTLSPTPPINILNIYEISRVDHFIVGPKTTFGWVFSPESAVDGNLDSFAQIYSYWGENERHDFLHVQCYVGDNSAITFSIKTAPSASGSELLVDGELEPDIWGNIARINLDSARTTEIQLLNARKYTSADGYLSLRTRWVSTSSDPDAFIYEIWADTN